MPIYEFIAEDGTEDKLDLVMPFDEAPDIGAAIWHEGRRWRRLVSQSAGVSVKKFKSFMSYTQPPIAAGTDPKASGVIADEWRPDPDDPSELRAVYTSEETARKNASASKDAGDLHLTWDE